MANVFIQAALWKQRKIKINNSKCDFKNNISE
jgi:hypothetical protein